MTQVSLVFSVEILLKQIKITKVGVVKPSLSVTIVKNNPRILWQADDTVQDGQDILIERAYQILVATDVFEATKTWKVGFNLTMQHDQVPLGTCTFECKSLIASALASCGASPSVSREGKFLDHHKDKAGELSFALRVIYFPGSEHRNDVEIILSRPIRNNPPEDTLYRHLLQMQTNSQNDFIFSQSNSSVGNESSSLYTGEPDSALLGSNRNYKFASEANRLQTQKQYQDFCGQALAPQDSNQSTHIKEIQTTIYTYQTTSSNASSKNNLNQISNLDQDSTLKSKSEHISSARKHSDHGITEEDEYNRSTNLQSHLTILSDDFVDDE